MTRRTPQAALHQAAEKRRPEGAILRRADVDAEDLALALAGDPDRDHGRQAGHAPVHPHLVVRRVDPQVRVLARERPRPKRRHQRVELGADPRHLGLRHRRRARGPASGRRPSASTRRARTLPGRRPAARAPPAGAAAAATGSRSPAAPSESPARSSRPACPTSASDTRCGTPVRSPRALVAVRADQPGHLGLHQRLREHPDALAEHVAVLLLEQLANERGKIHPALGHRRQHLRVVVLLPERTATEATSWLTNPRIVDTSVVKKSRSAGPMRSHKRSPCHRALPARKDSVLL